MNPQDNFSGIKRPNRVRHVYTQSINGAPEQVFPLLCPVREYDWAPGWATDFVISASAVAEQECVFQTPARSDAEGASTWIITRYEPDAFNVEMYKITPGYLVAKLVASLSPQGNNTTCAQVSYEYTSLGPTGDKFIDEFTASHYAEFMQGWEAAMNHYLETGELL